MKTYINYAYHYINIIVVMLIIITLFNTVGSIKDIDSEEVIVKTSSLSILPTTPRVITKEELEIEVAENIEQVIEIEEPAINVNYNINYINTDQSTVLATYNGNISHYGPDCNGCSGVTATGKNVENGNIFYNDKTYGKVRIVAADRSIPFGTIVRINNNTLAIVLDRGGIGFGKRFVMDLLCHDEETSYKYGVLYNSTIEVLRFGY